MKKIALLALSAFTLLSCNKEENSLTTMLLQGNVKSVMTKTYEVEKEFGEIRKGKRVENGYSMSHAKYEFNEDGWVDEITEYDSDGEITTRWTYKFKDGLLMETLVYDENGRLQQSQKNEFEGRLIKTQFNYDGDGNLTGKWVNKIEGDYVVQQDFYIYENNSYGYSEEMSEDVGMYDLDSTATDVGEYYSDSPYAVDSVVCVPAEPYVDSTYAEDEPYDYYVDSVASWSPSAYESSSMEDKQKTSMAYDGWDTPDSLVDEMWEELNEEEKFDRADRSGETDEAVGSNERDRSNSIREDHDDDGNCMLLWRIDLKYEDGKLVKQTRTVYSPAEDKPSVYVTKIGWEGDFICKYTTDDSMTKIKRDKNGIILETMHGRRTPNDAIDMMEGEDYRYEYEFDKEGNWTTCTEFLVGSDEPVTMVEREIKYYK